MCARGLDHLFRFLPYQERRVLKLSLGVADVDLISVRPELEGLKCRASSTGSPPPGRPIIARAAWDGEIAGLGQQNDCGTVVEPGEGELLADTLRWLHADTRPTCRNGTARPRPAPCSLYVPARLQAPAEPGRGRRSKLPKARIATRTSPVRGAGAMYGSGRTLFSPVQIATWRPRMSRSTRTRPESSS